jgi:Predicted Co/Zn/Cd cation transporters
VGISVALIGGPGWESADDWAALLASGIIMFNAYLLLRPAVAELADTAPAIEMRDSIREVALSVPGVVALDKCIVRKMGFDYYVDLHVIVDSDISVRQGHQVAHAVKDALRTSQPQVADVLVHIEPADIG